MARYTIDVNNNIASTVVDAYCDRYDYQSTISGEDRIPVPNPETRASFTKQRIKSEIRAVVREYRRSQAIEGLVIADPNITIS